MNSTHKEDYFYPLDWLRFLILVLGIPYHVWSALNKNFYNFESLQNFNFFNLNTVFWIMHLLRSQTFMFLSGFFIIKSISQVNVQNFFIKKTKRFLLPFIFGYVLLQPIIASIRAATLARLYQTNTDFFTELFKSYAQLFTGSLYFGIFWFLFFLFFYECIFAIILKSFSKYFNIKIILYVILFISIVLSYLSNTSIIWPEIGKPFLASFINIKTSHFIYYFVFFILGTILSIDTQLNIIFKRYYFCILQVSIISLIAIFSLGFIFNPESIFVIRILKALVLLTSISLVIGLFGMFCNYSNKKFNFVHATRKRSLELYISHYIYITLILSLLTQITHNLAILFFSATFGTLLLCALEVYFFSFGKISFKHN